MDLRAIFFDLDGTLVDSEPEIIRSALVAFGEVGGPALEYADIKPHMGCPLSELYDRFIGDGDAERAERFVESYRAAYEHNPGPDLLFPHAARVVAEFAKRYPLAVATTKPTDAARRIIESVGLAPYFKIVRGADDLPPKPDPAILIFLCEALGFEPDQVVMVGDTGTDIGAAKAAGIKVVGVTYGGWGRKRLKALEPDALIDGLDELPALMERFVA